MSRIYIDPDELHTIAASLRADIAVLGDIAGELNRGWGDVLAPEDEIANARFGAESVNNALTYLGNDVAIQATALDAEGWLRALEQLVVSAGWPAFLMSLIAGRTPTGALLTLNNGLAGFGAVATGPPTGMPPMLAAIFGTPVGGGGVSASSIDGAIGLANQILAGGIGFSPALARIGAVDLQNNVINDNFRFLSDVFGTDIRHAGQGFATPPPILDVAAGPGPGGFGGAIGGTPAATSFSGVSSFLPGGSFTNFQSANVDFIHNLAASHGMSDLGIPSMESALNIVTSGGGVHTASMPLGPSSFQNAIIGTNLHAAEAQFFPGGLSSVPNFFRSV